MRYATLALAVALAGCATPAFTPATRYYLDVAVDVPAAQALDKTLGVRPIEAALPYRQKVAYRDAGYVLGSYETIQWAELPRDMVTRALMDAITATNRFKDVGNASDMVAPDMLLTGELRRFDLVRTAEPWTAECEIRLELRETQNPNVIWAATLSAKEPLAENSPSALPAAMSRAIGTIVNKAAADMASK